MTAIAWSLVGLMAASLGILASALFAGIGRLDSRFDAQGARIDSLGARIDALGTSLGGRIDTQSADIRELRHTVHSLEERLTRAGG